MTQRRLAWLIPLALALAFAPLRAAFAANPSTQEEATADDAHWLAAVSASRITRNGTSVSGKKLFAIGLPGGARHAK